MTKFQAVDKCKGAGWMPGYTDKEMIKVSYYYYKSGMTQAEIAKRMKMSRQRVNRILKKALENNIVEIKINDLDKYNVDLENKLEEKYELKQVVIVSPIDKDTSFASLGLAGAEFLEGLLSKGDMVGATWGRTISELAKNLSTNKSLGVSAVQMIGGLNVANDNLQADEIARTIGKKLGGGSHILYAPALVDNMDVKDAFMSDMNIKETFNKMESCNIILAGIGELKEDTYLIRDEDVNESYKRYFLSKDAVGDIGFRWYNLDGQPVENEYENKTIGYNVLENKNDALVIGIAGGERKYQAILGALRGGYLDILITDTHTAKNLINHSM